MEKHDLERIIKKICPSELSEEWDNCGYQINCKNKNIRRLMVALEITDEVINEAVENNIDFVITHHPMLFNGIKSVDYNDITGMYLLRLMAEGISVFSCHTSFDKVFGGNNDYFGYLLEFDNIRPFDIDNGFCRKGETLFETTFIEILHKASEKLGVDEKYFKTVGCLSDTIDTVGWCSGAGSEFIKNAFDEGCQLFITGDVKYHEAQMARELGICLLDAGHYGTERIFTENMADKLRKAVENEIEIKESMIDVNPFTY